MPLSHLIGACLAGVRRQPSISTYYYMAQTEQALHAATLDLCHQLQALNVKYAEVSHCVCGGNSRFCFFLVLVFSVFGVFGAVNSFETEFGVLVSHGIICTYPFRKGVFFSLFLSSLSLSLS